uniref:Putative secreted protein n=1 Tax=Ixodes ricinus TaxID=34613 RepID=A0A6B0TR93_IXORI
MVIMTLLLAWFASYTVLNNEQGGLGFYQLGVQGLLRVQGPRVKANNFRNGRNSGTFKQINQFFFSFCF